jgi:hypothetical protein
VFEKSSKTPKHRVVSDALPNDHEQDTQKPKTPDEQQKNYLKAENAMYRFKTIFGSSLWARTVENQRVEARIKSRVLNRMTVLGLPESYAVA